MTRRTLLWIMFGLGLTVSQAQDRAAVVARLPLGSFASARSELFRMNAHQLLTVRSERTGGLAPAIFVIDEHGNLTAKNDESSASPNFEWRVPSGGRFRVLLFSNSESGDEYVIRVLNSRDRGPAGEKPTYAVVPVFWASDRNLTSLRPPQFEGQPAKNAGLSYGVCEVSVPLNYQKGQLEEASFFSSILRLESRHDPERHVAIVASAVSPSDRFLADVARYTLRSRQHEALVFIPGFATTFEEAALRTAQISYDLKFEGPAILFSWPSQGEADIANYIKDARNAEWSEEHLRALLLDLNRNSRIERVQVIAHGLGSLALVKALAGVSGAQRLVDHLALLAPDIDVVMFRKLAVDLRKASAHVSLYASSKDAEMKRAKSFTGYPRAGEAGPGLVVIPGIDTIDASNVDISMVVAQHQSYEGKRSILVDLFYMLRGDTPDRRLALRPARDHWVLR
jgi:esterase/lipase superfamily enzyme